MKLPKNHTFAKRLLLSSIVAGFLYYTISLVSAAGTAVTLTPAALAANTGTDVLFTYISSDEYQMGDSIEIVAPAGVTVTNCAAPTTDADGDTTTDGSSLVVSQTYTYLFSDDTTDATTTGVSFCVNYEAPTGNYALTFIDTKANSANNDFGGALLYVGDANVVVVSAQVQPILSFTIRNAADDGNTNSCPLGVLTPAAVSECSYRLKIGTNSSSGYVVSISSDGDLRRSGSGDVADSEDIDRVTDESGTISAGTEAYGLALLGNSTSTSTPVTEGTETGFNFSTDDSPIPIEGTNGTKVLYTSTTMNDPTTLSHSALVTHRATVDTGTLTGNYQHLVTYTVIANF